MTIASQVAQLVMKVQQDVADLVNRGDETLEQLFPPKDEQPEWATFDEDDDDPTSDRRRRRRAATANGSPRAGSRCSPAANRRRAPTTTRPPTTADVRARRRRRAGLRVADAGPVAGPADLAEGRRPRGAAGLRGGDQGARAVPDSAGQQDHPRDRQVTADDRAGQVRGESRVPVRTVAMMVKDWIDKLGTVWVEGQIAQLNDAAQLRARRSSRCATRPPTCRCQ